jgi:hypothetical protein
MFQPVESAILNIALMALCVLVSVIFLGVLHNVPPNLRMRVIMVVTFIAGLYYPLEFFIPDGTVLTPLRNRYLTPFLNPIGDAVAVMAAFTVGIGITNLCIVHARNISQRREGWGNSVVFFISMILMFVVTLANHYAPNLFCKATAENMMTPVQAAFSIMFDGVYTALNATVFSLLAFFITSAAYRAFRIRTAEAALLMAGALIVMLGQVPVGMWLTHWIPDESIFRFFRFEVLSEWLLANINMPAQRGILFGVWVGALAMALRIWLSLERGGYFGRQF